MKLVFVYRSKRVKLSQLFLVLRRRYVALSWWFRVWFARKLRRGLVLHQRHTYSNTFCHYPFTKVVLLSNVA